MRVLVLITDRPVPPNTGSRVRNFYLWPELKRQGVDIQILGFDQTPTHLKHKASLNYFEGEFFKPDRRPFLFRAVDILLNSYHHRPRSNALAKRVRELTYEWKPDIIHAEELRMGQFLKFFQGSPTPKKTCSFYNMESDWMRQTGSFPFVFGQKFFNKIHLHSLLQLEQSITSILDMGFAFSNVDCRRYRDLYPRTRWTISTNGAIASQIIPPPQTKDFKILFLGSLSYAPNISGVFWFLDQVLPKLSKNIVLTVAGSNATPEVRKKLASIPTVRFLDSPPELNSIYAENALSIVPLFQGSGTRGKILESLAYERMVITTPLGAEGLELAPGQGIAFAQTPKDFVEKIEFYLAQIESRTQFAKTGRQAVLEKYDWSVVAHHLKEAWLKINSEKLS